MHCTNYWIGTFDYIGGTKNAYVKQSKRIKEDDKEKTQEREGCDDVDVVGGWRQ